MNISLLQQLLVLLVGVDWGRVGLGVEHPLVQVHLMPVCKEEVEVLECLPKEEGLHHVPGPGVHGVPDVTDGGVAATHFAVSFYALQRETLWRTEKETAHNHI